MFRRSSSGLGLAAQLVGPETLAFPTCRMPSRSSSTASTAEIHTTLHPLAVKRTRAMYDDCAWQSRQISVVWRSRQSTCCVNLDRMVGDSTPTRHGRSPLYEPPPVQSRNVVSDPASSTSPTFFLRTEASRALASMTQALETPRNREEQRRAREQHRTPISFSSVPAQPNSFNLRGYTSARACHNPAVSQTHNKAPLIGPYPSHAKARQELPSHHESHYP